MTIKTGDSVIIATDGRIVRGVVELASPNGRSLMLSFEAILHGHVGRMPVLQDNDGLYRTLVGNHVVMVS